MRIVPISVLVVFTSLVVALAVATYIPAAKERADAVAAVPKADIKRAPVVAGTKSPEPVAVVRPSVPESHLPRPEQTRPPEKMTPPAPLVKPTIAAQLTPTAKTPPIGPSVLTTDADDTEGTARVSAPASKEMRKPSQSEKIDAKAEAKLEPVVHDKSQHSREDYYNLLGAAYLKLAHGQVDSAIDDLDRAKADPQFLEMSETISQDLDCLRAYKEYRSAAANGVSLLTKEIPFTLRTNDGKEIVVGPSSHSSVKEFKEGGIWIEEEMGGATATRKINFDQLAPQTMYELATLALTGGPASDFKLGVGGYVAILGGGANPVGELRSRLENAKKDAGLAPAASRVLDRLNTLINERAVSAGMKRVEAAIKGKDFALGKSLLRDFKRDYGATASPAVNDFIEKAAFDMSDLKEGLWASYYCGDEQNLARKYLFSRAETKLNFNWGRGSPDARVPNEFFTIRFNGLLRVRTAATYTFMATADDYLELSIDGKRLMTVTWNADTTIGKNCAIKLDAGDHEIRVIFKQYLVDSFINVKWKFDNESKWQDIPESRLWYDPRLVEKYQKDTF